MRQCPTTLAPPLAATEAKNKKLVANEYKILTEMNHKYVVKCHDAFETDEKLYLFMELMEGGLCLSCTCH